MEPAANLASEQRLADATVEPLLVMRNISRVFGQTKALVDANLTLRQGEVCGLLGANGAGKSTLSRIISGHIAPSGGDIRFRNAPFAISSTRDALRSGIALVAQETSLAPDMTVLENMFMPAYGMPGRLSFAKLRAKAYGILTELGHEQALPLDVEVRKLSAAQRQLVEIAKALALNADLVIFDEPTASLSPTEVERLFDIMSQLRQNGKALAFVSHRLEEVFAITDRVTILREGMTVALDEPTSGLSQADIIRHMVGQDIGSIHRRAAPKPEGDDRPIAFEVKGVRSLPYVRDVSFSVHEGEILGLGGLVGAGRSECAEAIFGLRHRDAGRVFVNGKDVSPKKPVAAIRAGIGMVAEDRRAQNIVPDMNVGENLFMAHMGRHRGFGRGYASRRAEAIRLIERLGLPADRMETSLLNFSGGMQQKIITARWLLIKPKVLILDEPTKGVDIGTRQTIYELLREVAAECVAIVVISSDFEELLGLSDRIVVMSDGYAIADLPSDRLTEESLTLLAAPRSSAERNSAFLKTLTDDFGGYAFWALLELDQLICLAASASAGVDLQLAPGSAYGFADTPIPVALRERKACFVAETAGGHHTYLKQLSSRRGHDLGWIGLTLPAQGELPDPTALSERISALHELDELKEETR